MTARKNEEAPDRTWQAFQRRHGDSPFLHEDPLYALTEDVLDAITEHVPEFFTDRQEQFERDLRRMTGSGFFLRRPLGTPTSLLDKPDLTIGEFLDAQPALAEKPARVVKRVAPSLKPEWFVEGRADEAVRAISDLLALLWKASGRADQDIQAAQRQERHERELLFRRGEAYLGWLVLNGQFRQELGALQAAWAAAVRRRGGFPRPTEAGSVAGEPGPRGQRDPCARACLAFCRRWCLERLLTWDLAAPLAARLHYRAEEGGASSGEEGVTLFIPWPLLRGGQFDLQQVARRVQFESTPEHLRAWVLRQSGGDRGATGEIRYQGVYGVYRCYELVLWRRYRSSCVGNIEKLDRALAAVMHREEDSVKRLRQRLARVRGN